MKRYILHTLVLIAMGLMALSAAAQSGNIRFVRTDGDNAKDGASWTNAKKDIQAAINDLVNNNLTGEVWVAAGDYYPTETTESTSSLYYKAFKIPAGITVRGGFAGNETSLADRVTVDDKNFGPGGDDAKTGMLEGEPSKSGVYQNKTILHGDLTPSKRATFKWNDKKQQFDAAFYGNSYHVVWFAMNGFDAGGRANPLAKPAKLEGCVVEGGHANNRDVNAVHPHEAYGGGIYMVLGSFVYNCEVRNCDASRNGGGIYMDGGGVVRRTYVYDCQALGIGTEYGYGGGICENGSAITSKARPVVVAQSVVTNCVGRMGGGMALLANATVGDNRYAVVASSTLVNNNTATIEAGGVYTYRGGGVASMTIVNNRCNGSGITQNGSITGRSGGLYSYDAAYVGNTVIWGNECEANRDIQYATARSNLSSTEKSHFYHNALSHADIADWSTTSKLNVVSLEAANAASADSHTTKGFPLFRKPSTKTIDAHDDRPAQTVNAAGYYPPYSTAAPQTEWIVSSESALTYAGINTADLDNEGLTPAPTGKAYDMQFGVFNARPTIGALIAEKVDIAPKTDGERVDFYVDPAFVYAVNNTGDNGNSWTTPVRFLGNVLDYIANQNKQGAYDGKHVYVHVKEGTVDNTRAESDEDRVRTTPLSIPNGVTILGSYDSSLSDTDLRRRNPVLTPTVISARLMNNYDFNVAHLIVIDGKQDVTIDGFKLSFANAHSTALASVDTDGAAIMLKNCVKHDGDRDPNIHFRNLTISNCYGDKGTVVYADHSAADFENCIFHNNTTHIVEGSGLVYGINHSDLRFDHCNVLRSVGHASYLDATTTNVWKNSMFYGNLREKQDNTNKCNYYSIAAFDGPGAVPANLTGERCMFDLVSKPLYDKAPFNLGAGIPANSTYYVRTKGKDVNLTEENVNGLEYAYTSGWANGYPCMVNPTKNAGYSTEGDVTYYGRATSFEPHNDNPVVNAGSTNGEPHSARQWGTDITTVVTRDFGGLPDIGAIESHTANVDEIASENGNPDGQMPYGVAYYVRDYAQDGLQQTYTKLDDGTFAAAADGKGNYVKEGDDYIFLDGASWQYAVSGNAPYTEDYNDFRIATFVAKEKVAASDESFLIYNSIRGRYIYLNGTAIATTNDVNKATKWYVKGTGATGTISGSGNQVVYAKASNGSTYCLSFSNNSPYAAKSDNTSIYLQYVSGSNYRIRISSSNTSYLYSASLSGFNSRNNQSNNYSLWEFRDQNTAQPAVYEEGPNPASAVPDGTKNVALNGTVGSSEKLHAYESIDDYKKLSDVAVTYKIAQQPGGSGAIAGYLTTNGNSYAVTNATTGNTYVLISAKEDYKYYIYDVTTGRYLHNYNNAASPIRETSDESERSPWFVVKGDVDDRFNISLGIGSSIPTTGWINGGSGNNVTLATTSGNNAQWVLVAQKAYTPYGVTVTQHGLNGLQYAVNTVHNEYVASGVQHEVHVAQGVYTNSSPANAVLTVYQPYAYMMQEGVNVLGGYPTIGNPGDDQRQPKTYETILQAQKQSPYVTMTFVTGADHPDRIRVNSNQDSWNDMMSVTDWGSCSSLTDANDKASVARVLVQAGDYDVQTAWDGFTIRHGYLNTAYRKNLSSLASLTTDNIKVAGGAGVLLQGNGMLVNCEIKENLILVTPGGKLTTMGDDNENTDSHSHFTNHSAGAGVFMTGSASTATIENCNIGNNQLLTKAVYTVTGSTHGTTYDNIWMYGAGLFQNNGNVYNTIIHDNTAATIRGTMGDWMNASPAENQEMILGGGAFIADGNFFNNTIVANSATSFYHQHVSHCTFAGVHVKDQARIYNSIIADNVSNWGFKNSWNASNSESPGNGVPVSAFETNSIAKSSRDPSKVFVTYSYVDVHKQEKGVAAGVTTWVDLASTNDKSNTNIYLDYAQHEAFVSSRKTVTHPTTSVYDHAAGENRYRLIAGSPCINTGTVNIKDAQGNAVIIPDFDAGYDDRVQDCKIDIGAYESDGRANIKPQTVGDQLVFYVSPDGFGRTDGSDPENAACAPKLQMVIDAAGRYKLQNPTKQVIVKVANSYNLLHPANGEPTHFTYYSTRTADQTSTDTRLWSIQIPRGVEVWGGYTDVPTVRDANGNVVKNTSNTTWSNSNNGYQYRSITGNPTYFDSYFYNKDMKINATTYHVVTFTERVYDKEGHPYLAKDYNSSTQQLTEHSSYTGTEVDETLFLHMKDYVSGNVMATKVNGKTVSNRAVLDGIFVTGGNADGKTIAGSSYLNTNGYGGAAIVTDYAYVRNCIVMNNSATNGGGLALTNEALVSGSLIIENNADNMGGGLYVFEEGATLSNGTVIDSKAPTGQVTDYRMAHVLTSTIVGNTAQQGGGVWYTNDTDANARFNSVVIWQNQATDQENVYGMVNPEQPTDDETTAEIFYPFAYSLIQNIRASGTNNLSAEPLNEQGVRFVDKTTDVGQTKNGVSTLDQYNMAMENEDSDLEQKLSNFGFYGLTHYSMLCSNGMPVYLYSQMKDAIAIADDDLLGTQRVSDKSKFVEIGARALPKEFPTKQLMLRLFVANPEDVDTKTAGRFMRLANTAGAGSAAEYYSQEGSSFAYPFNFLQDALDYVKAARNGEIITGNDDPKNLPFEILVAVGTYYPRKDLNGETQSVWAQTLAIPEGVTIVGGFEPKGGNGTYYGRYNQAKATINTTPASESNHDKAAMSIYNNVEPIPTDIQSASGSGQREVGRGYKSGEETVTLTKIGDETADPVITFQQWDIQDICDRRAMTDNNKNGIIEPWEFRYQTIISGNAVNGETDGVYHVMTAVADADAVGNLPTAGYVYDVSFQTEPETGYQCKEYGQQIRLNGLIITGGNGLTYLSTALDEYGKYIFYQGAGLQVDGNRYKAAIDAPNAPRTAPVFHNSAAYGVGYRDIPISIINCQFRNNIAGYGGAISTNGTLDTYASSFEQNLAIAQTETPEDGDEWYTMVSGSKQTVNKVMYPGQGGAILATSQLSCYNTLFANNEARMGENEAAPNNGITLVKHPTFRVPDENAASPTLRAAGGAIMIGNAGRYHMMNCDFVRNKANAYPVIFTMNPNSTEDEKGENEQTSTERYNQIVSTVVWGNEVNPDMLSRYQSNPYYQFASKMMVNVGKKDREGADYPPYNPSFVEGNVPSSQTDLDQNWKEFVWFSAYEDGIGFTQNNTYDLRDHIIFKTGQFVNWNIKNAAKKLKETDSTVPDGHYQNCNIQIVAENDDVAGPNFGTPSYRAGYDGFMEGADWSPTRFNRLTDNGSGWIKQTVTQTDDDFKVTFDTPDPAHKDDYYQGGYPVAHYDTYPEYKLWLAIGNEKYMQATNDEEKDEIFINGTSIGHPNKNLLRFSPDPTMGVTRAYIDIGVYEYIKEPLLKPGSEVDILWVSTKEHPENGSADGSRWDRPTSDLQRAINSLLNSRNGHKKEIRIMEGEYAPVTAQTVAGKLYNAFVIDTKALNTTAITPTGFQDGTNNNKYYAQSLTIKGGYSAELMYEYDPIKYKTVIRQTKPFTGASTDHLFYIADPTLRYAYANDGYKDSNKYGAIWTAASGEESNTARTMPIQIDGVTLINDKAKASTQGSAIYYPNMADITEAHSISVGGKVVYYATKDDLNNKENPVNYETEYAEITTTGAENIKNPAKLVVTKTQVVGSGAPTDDVPTAASAVYIGQNGGSALIYNSVFHSNYGMALDAWNTVNVNNTFGLNAGRVQLQDAAGVTVKSAMHNSALWKNNPNSGSNPTTFGVQFSIPSVTVDGSGNTGHACDNFTYNAFTGGNPAVDYNEANSTISSNNYNTGLADENSDLGRGPNFVDPENADIEARNFDIKPSVRLLNRGSLTTTAGTYYDKVMHYDLGEEKYANYDYALAPTTNVDVMNRPRFANNIDIGAYEFQGRLYNPLYVDPNKSHSDDATGENWDKAFGYGDIQNAMDLVAIYHLNNPNEEGFVFVKGASATNKDLHTAETLTIRDGVTVYGGIASNYADWHGMKNASNTADLYADIPAYIADMASMREGVASHSANKTVVTAIKTSESTAFGNDSDYPALIDGFVVSPVSATQQPTAPVIDMTNTSAGASIVLRNIIVADNDLSGAPDAAGTKINVAQVSNGLLYEVLMRDNKPKGDGAALRVSNATVTPASPGEPYTTKGYAVNVTVEGKTIDANGNSLVDTDGGHIFSSITNSIDAGEGTNAAGAAAPYGRITNPDISGYFYNIGDANLNYQLTETSRYIDQCEVSENGEGHPTFLPDNLKPFVTYSTDRDILGNPRLLTGVTDGQTIDTRHCRLDRGAFETWKVDNTAGKFQCGDNGTINTIEPYAANADGAYTVIKKHFYPHDGSVCYIMKGQTLIIDAVDPAHKVKPTPHTPGYMLLKEGASFYGNGRPATCAYVAVERTVRKEHGSIVSVPYAMNYTSGVSLPTYTDGRLTALTTDVTEGVYDYNGSARSDWDYIFQTEATGCWSPIVSATTAANHGTLVEAKSTCFPDEATEATLRFTAKGTSLTDYVYTEDGPSKTVVLTQYDKDYSENGEAEFTKQEDMGWNCIGLPYLVSDYKPYDKVNTATGKSSNDGTAYRMNLPHTLWLFYDGVEDGNGTNVNGDGGYYSVDAWEDATSAWHVSNASDTRIWVGEGFFTQTATTSDDETLTFYLPDPTSLLIAAPSNRRNMRFYFDDNDDDNDDDDDDDDDDDNDDERLAPVLLRTEYYSTAGRRITRPETIGVTIIREVYSDGTVRTFKRR